VCGRYFARFTLNDKGCKYRDGFNLHFRGIDKISK